MKHMTTAIASAIADMLQEVIEREGQPKVEAPDSTGALIAAPHPLSEFPAVPSRSSRPVIH